MDIKIGSFNVKGLGSKIKRQQLFQFIKENDFNICFVQETHYTVADKYQWEQEWGGDLFFSGEFGNKEGVGILIASNFNYEIIQYTEVVTGRIQSLKLNISEKEYTLINIYGPNENSYKFYETLEAYVESIENDTLILGGDFNTILNPDLDKKNGRKDTNKKSRDKILSLMNKYNLHDIWRILNPNTRKYTWHSNNRPPIFCRLDYFLVSENVINRVTKSKITTGYKSDHSIVYLLLQTQNNKRGPGYFKINNSLLLKPDYQERIKQSITEISDINKDANPITLWEIIKGTIRNETIKYACIEKKKDMNREKQLIEEITTLETTFSNTTDEHVLAEINDKKSVLQNIHDKKVKGIMLRTKAEWIEGGEKNTKYFANLERKRSESKTITRLNINDKIITDDSEILYEEQEYYKQECRQRHVSPRFGA